MTDIRTLRKEANRLIRQGETQYKKRVAEGRFGTLKAVNLKTGEVWTKRYRRRPPEKDEFHLIYAKARDYLQKHGYQKELNPKAQKLYFELIPEDAEFQQQKKTTLKDLQSRSSARRASAVKRIVKGGCAAFMAEEWVKHPLAIETLIAASQAETSPRVSRDMIIGLASIYDRYFKDCRILPELLAAFDSPHKEVVDAAIGWTSRINNAEKWKRVVDLLQSQPSQSRLKLLLGHVNERIPVGMKRKLQPLLLGFWTAKLSAATKTNLANAILDIADERTVDDLRDAIQGMRGLKTELKKLAKGKLIERSGFLMTRLKL